MAAVVPAEILADLEPPTARLIGLGEDTAAEVALGEVADDAGILAVHHGDAAPIIHRLVAGIATSRLFRTIHATAIRPGEIRLNTATEVAWLAAVSCCQQPIRTSPRFSRIARNRPGPGRARRAWHG